jgi:hypothetical protein
MIWRWTLRDGRRLPTEDVDLVGTPRFGWPLVILVACRRARFAPAGMNRAKILSMR